MYLDVAEKDALHVRRGPERTLRLFEKYLPYALALGVENAWAEQFSDILARARAQGGADAMPRWYSGASWSAPGTVSPAPCPGDCPAPLPQPPLRPAAAVPAAGAAALPAGVVVAEAGEAGKRRD